MSTHITRTAPHTEPHPQPSAPSMPQPSSRTTLTHDERGTSTVEYVILLVLVTVIALTAWSELGSAMVEKIRYATDAILSLGA